MLDMGCTDEDGDWLSEVKGGIIDEVLQDLMNNNMLLPPLRL